MACFRCEKPQTDPIKGASPWARFVIKGEQVLMCPDCQSEAGDWSALSDHCPHCESTKLVVMLGSVVCKACGRDFERTTFR